MGTENLQSWESLQSQADNGSLQLEDGAVESCRDACNAVIARMLALKNQLKQMSNIDSFSPSLDSSASLTNKFVTTSQDLEDILQKHIDNQEDMAATFLAAGRSYINNEVDSSERFDRLRALDNLPDTASKPGDFHKDPNNVEQTYVQPGSHGFDNLDQGKIRNQNGNPNGSYVGQASDRLRQYDGDMFRGTPAEGENADLLSYAQLRQIGSEMDSETPSTRAGQWYWIADELDDVFTEFVNNVGAVVNGDQWKGDGAAAAGTATNQYVSDTQSLRQGVRLVADNFSYTAGWLFLTQTSMPHGEDVSGQESNPPDGPVLSAPGGGPPPEGIEYPSQLPIYRQNFENTYLVGLPESDSSFPALPNPTSPTSGVDPGGNPPGGGPAGGGAPGGGPAGGGPTVPPPAAGGPGTAPGPDPAQQKQAQEAARRQQQEAVRQQQQAQEAAREQQAQQSGQQAMQQAMQAGQQGVQQAMSAAQQAAQQATQQEAARGMAGLTSPAAAGLDPKTGLPKGAGAAGGGAGAGSGSSAAGASSPAAREANQASKLFPRANPAAAPTSAAMNNAGRAGAAPMGGTPGSPGAAGAAGKGAQENNEHKRPSYLDSTEHLEEALGDAPQVVKPVVEK